MLRFEGGLGSSLYHTTASTLKKELISHENPVKKILGHRQKILLNSRDILNFVIHAIIMFYVTSQSFNEHESIMDNIKKVI